MVKNGKESWWHEKKCNQWKQWKHPKNGGKISGEKMKIHEETVMKNPKGFSLKNRSFYFVTRKFNFRKYKKFFQSGFFYFSISESYFLKYKMFFKVSVSWNIKKFHFLKYKEFFWGFRFLKYKKSLLLGKYKKSFILRKYKKFLNIRARK